jgi:hypothetical protein
VYMRLGYGIGGTTSTPRLQLSVGGSTDGAGTLADAGSGAAVVSIVDGVDNASRSCYITSDGDGFAFVHAYDSTVSNVKTVTVIDRQRRADGLAQRHSSAWNNTGFVRLHLGTTAKVLTVDPVSGDEIAVTKIPAVVGRSLSTVQSMVGAGGEMTMFPLLLANRQGLYLSKMVLGYPSLDAALNTDLTVDHLGASRTYRALGNKYTGFDMQGNAGSSFAIWWG